MLNKAQVVFSHVFFYDQAKLKNIPLDKKKSIKSDDALYPYIENFYFSQNGDRDSPPFSLNITGSDIQGIVVKYSEKNKNEIKKNDRYFFLPIKKLTIHFYPKDIAILTIQIEEPFTENKKNKNWDISKEQKLANIVNKMSVISRKWHGKNNSVKIIKVLNKKNFYFDTNSAFSEEVINDDYTIRSNSEGKKRVRGFLEKPSETLSEDIKNAMNINKEKYNKEVGGIHSHYDWIISLINPYVKDPKDDRYTNPFNSTRMHSYIITQTKNEPLNSKLINALTIQTKNIERMSNEIFFDTHHVTSSIQLHANENISIFQEIEEANSIYSSNTYFENYMNIYFPITLIVLYQKAKLEHLILQSSKLNYETKNIKEATELKSEILYYMNKIDYTNISNNIVRNNVYKYLRKIMNIGELHQEAKSVIMHINNDLQNINKNKSDHRSNIRDWSLGTIGVLLTILSAIVAVLELNK